MAESKIVPLHRFDWFNVTTYSHTYNFSKYKGTSQGGFGFLVAIRPWAGTSVTQANLGALYYVSGIQGGLYQSCTPVFRHNDYAYAPSVTISGNNLILKGLQSVTGASLGFVAGIYPLFAY